MSSWQEIALRTEAGKRLSPEDALTLWREAPLWLLGELAVGIKRAKSGGGKIVIDFANDEEIASFIERLQNR